MANLPMRFIADEPISLRANDVLGFSEFVDLIETSIEATDPPFVYGVLGDWGVGKTSILRLLHGRYITEQTKRKIIPIWFNAWEYENESNIIYPLLHRIKTAFDEVEADEEAKHTFLRRMRKVAVTSSIVLGRLALDAVLKKFTYDALELENLEDAFKEAQEHVPLRKVDKALSTWSDSVDLLKTAFRELLDAYARALDSDNAKSYRFIIFVDDLDRCLPDTTIKLLESIKNFLTYKNRAIFVMGLNADVVYLGIRHKYGNLNINGREYLEKILNYTFYVPQPEPDRVLEFASASLSRLTNGEPVWERFATHFIEFGRILTTARFTNPRKIKRILNRFLLFISKYDDHPQNLNDFNIGNVIRLLIIAEYYPTVFQLLLNGTYDPLERPAEQIGAHNFSINDFESKYGTSIREIYPQLAQHQDLFTGLEKRETTREFDLPQHVRAVYTISRII